MDIKDQKDTWDGFVKLGIIAGGAVIVILILMAVFLV